MPPLLSVLCDSPVSHFSLVDSPALAAQVHSDSSVDLQIVHASLVRSDPTDGANKNELDNGGLPSISSLSQPMYVSYW